MHRDPIGPGEGVVEQTNGAVRHLIWVPIVHTQEDMGHLREAVRQQFLRKHGPVAWEAHIRAIDAFWEGARGRLGELLPSATHLRIYQDGLPVCGKEEQIVRDLARGGSRNHRLILDFLDRGAVLEGTESHWLLLEEYQMALQMLGDPKAPPTAETAADFERRSRELLRRRDRFIADRIAQTLKHGETGLIFLGMLHSLDGLLPADLTVSKLEVAELDS